MKLLFTLIGMKYRGTEALAKSLPVGEPVTLVRDRDNPHDRNAVQVHARDTVLGYVKGTEAQDLAAAMDASGDHTTTGQIAASAGWPMIEVEI